MVHSQSAGGGGVRVNSLVHKEREWKVKRRLKKGLKQIKKGNYWHREFIRTA